MKLRTLATTTITVSAIALFAAAAPSAEAQTPPAATVDVTASAASIEVPGSFSATATFDVANLGGGPADPKVDILLLFSPPDFLSHASVVGSPTVTGPDPAPFCRSEIGGRA